MVYEQLTAQSCRLSGTKGRRIQAPKPPLVPDLIEADLTFNELASTLDTGFKA